MRPLLYLCPIHQVPYTQSCPFCVAELDLPLDDLDAYVDERDTKEPGFKERVDNKLAALPRAKTPKTTKQTVRDTPHPGTPETPSK